MSGLTPAQTIGPFFSIALAWPGGNVLINGDDNAAMRIRGRVFDGDGLPVTDALIEIWQANAAGVYGEPTDPGGVYGFGRAATDDTGTYSFTTIKPGAIDDPAIGRQAPHINMSVFARGLLQGLQTRLYFGEDTTMHALDPILNLVPAARRQTLIARRNGDTYTFDIHLQGEHETVFFAL